MKRNFCRRWYWILLPNILESISLPKTMMMMVIRVHLEWASLNKTPRSHFSGGRHKLLTIQDHSNGIPYILLAPKTQEKERKKERQRGSLWPATLLNSIYRPPSESKANRVKGPLSHFIVQSTEIVKPFVVSVAHTGWNAAFFAPNASSSSSPKWWWFNKQMLGERTWPQ